MTIHLRCANCNAEFNHSETRPARNVLGRHEIGDVFSDRECPGCGCLVFPITEEEHDRQFRTLRTFKVYIPAGLHHVYEVRATDEKKAIEIALDYTGTDLRVKKLPREVLSGGDLDPPVAMLVEGD